MIEKVPNPDEFLRPAEFVETYPNLMTRGQLKYLIDARHHNGFDQAVRRLNYRRFLIHVPTALAWINRQEG